MEKNYEKMVELFKVEELQERLEFGEWNASASAESSPQGGVSVEASASWTSDWSEAAE